MKVKIVDALKTKYANLGFGVKAFDGVAEYLAKTVTEESQIETAVSGVESLLKVFQSDIDRERNEKVTIQKKLEEIESATKNNEGRNNSELKEKPQDTEPAWFTAYKKEQEEKLRTIEEKSQDFFSRQQQESVKALVSEKAEKLGIPQTRLIGVSFSDQESVDSVLSQIKEAMVKEGLGSKPPLFGEQRNGVSQAVQERIERQKERLSHMPPAIKGLNNF